MSSFSNSSTREACMAAPRAARSDGLIAVAEVEGAQTVVDSGKSDWTERATFGV